MKEERIMSTKSSASSKVFQMKVMLEDSRPPIWRRILVGDDLTFYKFHMLLQTVMGWTNSHLHMFQLGELIIGDPEDDESGELGFKNERKYKLSQFNFGEGNKFVYEYDFGDSWRHKITIEKVLPYSAEMQLPVCIKGKGACPPEDVGGVWGYDTFLEAIADPNHKEHAMYVEWVGDDFDPQYFNLDEINAALKSFK
jgi:hypothetical protein